MKLFEFNKTQFTVHITEEVIFLKPLKDVFDKDKSEDKSKALSELSYIWFFADIKSPYQYILDEKERSDEILKDIYGLPKGWKPDKKVTEAILFYKSIDKSALRNIYDGAKSAADAVNDVFKNAKAYIAASDNPIDAAKKVIEGLKGLPAVMDSLDAAEKRLIREVEEKEGRKKGSKELSMFEDGLKFD